MCKHHSCSCHNHTARGVFGISKSLIIRISLSLLIFALIYILKLENPYKIWAFAAAYVISGYDIIFSAVKNIFSKHFLDENFLMTIATLGAFIIGEYPEALMVIVLYQIGEAFNSYASAKSRKSISELMKIKPEYANIIEGSEVLRSDPSKVRIGDIIVVKPGEKIPLDGTVIEGFASIDTSSLTGEAIPREIGPENQAVSGCINLNGIIKIRVEKEFQNSTVSKILEMVENAGSKKAKAENFITKFARIYTPVVVGFALVFALVVPLFNGNFNEWFYRALTFLVISCPCALVISVPMGFFSGLGAASRAGILVKGGAYLEKLSGTKIIAFDKTGTLTTGEFQVSKTVSAEPEKISEEEILKLAAHVEALSNHPIANSIKANYKENIDLSIVKNVKEEAGQGISANVDGKKVTIGSKKIMENAKIKVPEAPEAGTIVYVALNKEFIGYFVIKDSIKNGAKAAISALKKKCHIRKTVMLTGDKENAALEAGSALGIDKVIWGLLPDEKVNEVENLLKSKVSGESLAFVGDGINDAPVLARADVGISMGALGSDAAIEACDVVIMDDSLIKIPVGIKIAKKTMQIVHQNVVFILAVKALFLWLGALGQATMWMAVFADVGVTILAVLNSLRIAFLKTDIN